MQIEEDCYSPMLKAEVCIILRILRKSNTIIVLLFIQNVSKLVKLVDFLQTFGLFLDTVK